MSSGGAWTLSLLGLALAWVGAFLGFAFGLPVLGLNQHGRNSVEVTAVGEGLAAFALFPRRNPSDPGRSRLGGASTPYTGGASSRSGMPNPGFRGSCCAECPAQRLGSDTDSARVHCLRCEPAPGCHAVGLAGASVAGVRLIAPPGAGS